jgi:hypothetical protein
MSENERFSGSNPDGDSQEAEAILIPGEIMDTLSKNMASLKNVYREVISNTSVLEILNGILKPFSYDERVCVERYLTGVDCPFKRSCSPYVRSVLEKAMIHINDYIQEIEGFEWEDKNNAEEQISLLFKISQMLFDTPVGGPLSRICSCIEGDLLFPDRKTGLKTYCKIGGADCPYNIRFDSWGLKTLEDILTWNSKVKAVCITCQHNIDMLKLVSTESYFKKQSGGDENNKLFSCSEIQKNINVPKLPTGATLKDIEKMLPYISHRMSPQALAERDAIKTGLLEQLKQQKDKHLSGEEPIK